MGERSHSQREGQKKMTGDSYEKEVLDHLQRLLEKTKTATEFEIVFKPGKQSIFDRLANKNVTYDADMLIREIVSKKIVACIGCKYSQRDRWLQDDRHARVVLDNLGLPWLQFTREKYGKKACCPIENIHAWMGDVTDEAGLRRVFLSIIRRN